MLQAKKTKDSERNRKSKTEVNKEKREKGGGVAMQKMCR